MQSIKSKGIVNKMSKIEQIIEEIEEYIDNCKTYPLSSSKIIVNKDEIQELLSELRNKTPEEIKRYQKIISNKEGILADAQSKADAIIAQAQVKTDELISEHQIMQRAYAQANEVVMSATKQAQEILDNATNDANNIRMSALQYTDDILGNLENAIARSMDASRVRHDSYMNSLQEFYTIVSSNRAELNPTVDVDEVSGSSMSEAYGTGEGSDDMIG